MTSYDRLGVVVKADVLNTPHTDTKKPPKGVVAVVPVSGVTISIKGVSVCGG